MIALAVKPDCPIKHIAVDRPTHARFVGFIKFAFVYSVRLIHIQSHKIKRLINLCHILFVCFEKTVSCNRLAKQNRVRPPTVVHQTDARIESFAACSFNFRCAVILWNKRTRRHSYTDFCRCFCIFANDLNGFSVSKHTNSCCLWNVLQTELEWSMYHIAIAKHNKTLWLVHRYPICNLIRQGIYNNFCIFFKKRYDFFA